MHRAEVQRVRGIFLHFLPQPQDVIIDRARARIIPIPPNMVQQLFAREHALRVLDHELQDLELLRSQLHQVPFPPQFHLREINLHVAKLESLGQRNPRRAPHRRPHPRQKFSRTEGLRDVVMCTQLQQQHLVHHFRSRTENDDRERKGRQAGCSLHPPSQRPPPASPANSGPAPARTVPPPGTSPGPRPRSLQYPPRSLPLQTIALELFGRRDRPRSPKFALHPPPPFPSAPPLKIGFCSPPPPPHDWPESYP